MSLALKVELPPGSSVNYKQLKFKSSTLVSSAITEIIDGGEVYPSASLGEYVLAHSPALFSHKTIFMDNDKPLSTYNLQAKDTVELKRKHQLIRIKYRGSVERFVVNISEQLRKLLPVISKQFGITDSFEGYKMYQAANQSELNLDKSIRELSVSPDRIFYLLHPEDDKTVIEESDLDRIYEIPRYEEEERKPKRSSSVSTSTAEAASRASLSVEEEPIDLQHATVKTLRNITKQGAVTLKTSQTSKKPKSRYLVLKDKHLLIFKTTSDKKPWFVCNVTDFIVKDMHSDENSKTTSGKDSKQEKRRETVVFSQNSFELFKKDEAPTGIEQNTNNNNNATKETASKEQSKDKEKGKEKDSKSKEKEKEKSKEKSKEKDSKSKEKDTKSKDSKELSSSASSASTNSSGSSKDKEGSSTSDKSSKKSYKYLCIRCENEKELIEWVNLITEASTPKSPSVVPSKGVFGAPLEKVVKGTGKVPEVVEQCIQYITQKALDTVGIFRLSGSATQIDQYKEAFDRGEKVDLFKEHDPHAVAGLLKLYFRMLPEPIMTYGMYHQFITAQCAPNRNLRIRLVRKLVNELPKTNYNLLNVLIAFLSKVRGHSAVNKMEIHNLATVFGPNLLVSEDRSVITMVQDTPQINGMVNTLIQDYEHIFLNKEMEDELEAVALYDFTAENDVQISLKTGDVIKVIAQFENGWWSGEVNGKIGQFPGSYVKIEAKTKKEKFLEDMKLVKKKLEEESQQLSMLQSSKDKIEEEIQNIEKERQEYEKQVEELRGFVLAALSKSSTTIGPKLEKYVDKVKQCKDLNGKLEATEVHLKEDVDRLNEFIANPSADAKKTLKGKAAEKLESEVKMLEQKIGEYDRRQKCSSIHFNNLSRDLGHFHQLTTPSKQTESQPN